MKKQNNIEPEDKFFLALAKKFNSSSGSPKGPLSGCESVRILEDGSRDLVYDKKSVKEKIQEAQKELKEDIEEQRKELKDLYDMLRPKGKDSDSVRICLLTEKMNLLQIQKKKIDKVFINKFGEKLIK